MPEESNPERNAAVRDSASLLTRVDHLVYASPDLQAGITRIEELLGVRVMSGGQHLGAGTRNAVVALGPASYLEIIGPDSEQSFHGTRLFGIDSLISPRLVTWAANGTDLERIAETELEGGVRLGSLSSGSRQTPQGLTLSWRYTNPATVVAEGVVPFFIDWGITPHPAASAPAGLTLLDLRAEHPKPDRVQTLLHQLGLDLRISSGPRPALIARIDTPRGPIELR